MGALIFGIVALAVVMARNGATRAQRAANLAYVALVLGYFAVILVGPSFETVDGHRFQVVGQKLIALGSMVHVIFLTTSLRRRA